MGGEVAHNGHGKRGGREVPVPKTTTTTTALALVAHLGRGSRLWVLKSASASAVPQLELPPAAAGHHWGYPAAPAAIGHPPNPTASAERAAVRNLAASRELSHATHISVGATNARPPLWYSHVHLNTPVIRLDQHGLTRSRVFPSPGLPQRNPLELEPRVTP